MIRWAVILSLFATLAGAQVAPLLLRDSTEPDLAIASGLIAHYPFNGTAANTVDGTLIPNSSFAGPGSRQEYYLANRVTNANFNALYGKSSMTLSCWWRLENKTTPFCRGITVGANAGGVLTLITSSTGSTIEPYFLNTSAPSWERYSLGGVFSTGVWFHCAVTYNLTGNNCPVLYINGIQQATTNGFIGTAVPFTGTNVLTTGQLPSVARVQGVAIYDRNLSSNEIWTLYSGFVAPP
jgi:hypothetical protein